MKKTVFYIAISIVLTSCAANYSEIGSLGTLSDRHINADAHYRQLAIAVGVKKKEIKKSQATSMKQAIEQQLVKVPGGEYLTNVKIYAVNGDYLAVSGDVWGVKVTWGNSGAVKTTSAKTKPAVVVAMVR